MDTPRRLRIAIATMYVVFAFGVLALSAFSINRDFDGQHAEAADPILGWADVICMGTAAWALDRHRLWGLVPAATTFLIQLLSWQRSEPAPRALRW